MLLAVLLLTNCSSISTTTDYDPEVDFSKYKTYKWYSGEMPTDDVLSQNPLIRKRAINSVDKVLAEKGFTKADSDEFDFVVIIHAGTKEKMSVDTYNYGGYGYGRYGRGWGGYGGMSTTDVRYHTEATIFVDIADVEKKELVWRGTGTGVVGNKDKTREEAQEDADYVMNKIMQDFPPQKD